MAVYRPARKIIPHPAVLAVIGISILVVVMLLIAATKPALAPDDPGTKALEAAEGLDVFTVEYPKVLQGATSGAGAALERAKQAWSIASSAFKSLNAQGASELDADFSSLDAMVSAKAPADEVTALADSIRQRLLLLGKPQGVGTVSPATAASTQNPQ